MSTEATCHECGTPLREREIDYYQTRAVDPDTGEERDVVVTGLRVQECPSCGERVLDAEAVDRIDAARARAFHLLLPEEIAELPQKLGITQTEFGELLGLGAKTLSRWANGHLSPSRAMNNYLRIVDLASQEPALLAVLLDQVFGRALPESARRMRSGRFVQPIIDKIKQSRPGYGAKPANGAPTADDQGSRQTQR